MSAPRLKHFGWGREGEGLSAEEEAFVLSRAEARFGTSLQVSASAPTLDEITLPAPRVTAPASLPFCTTDHYDRAAHSYGKAYPELVRGLARDYSNAPDVVAYPRNEEEVAAVEPDPTPTPVSALIHAATMVTAGVFMLARCSPLFEQSPQALEVVTIVGALTAFVAATIGLTQFDIKRVIAYSTMSQLGYMFFAIGVSAYSAAIFHLMTHAFFKALLFLGAGSVIHAMGGEQDMRKMGGIWKLIPSTYAMMWIGSLALAGVGIPGVFGFAGFYSKDMILEAAWGAHTGVGVFAYWLGVLAALMTAFYSGRLLFLTFHGKPRADHDTMHHVHESPPAMLVPLFVLATGAVLAGIAFAPYFVGEHMSEFWGNAIYFGADNHVPQDAEEVPMWVKVLPLVMGLIGIAFAFYAYMRTRDLPAKLAKAFGPIYTFVFNKWFFDELYDAVFVKGAQWLGDLFWKGGDQKLIDGLGPDGVSAVSLEVGKGAGRLQTGFLYHYAFVMLLGVAAILTYALWAWAA